MSYSLALIGAGNMGQAILRGALSSGVLKPDEVLVVELDPGKRREMETLGCAVSDQPAQAVGSRQILLAVKPQGFPAVAEAIGELPEPTVVISVMAGLTSGRIREALGDHARIIRVMPNTPCQIGLGASALAFGEGAVPGDDELARQLFAAVGEVVTVDESHIYAVTAVSGGGPAYVFLLAEAMEQGAIELGIEPEAARRLVRSTIRGAGALMIESNEEPEALRKAVTSPGGTTAECLKVMFDRDLPRIVADGLAAARDRGIELDE